MTMHVKCFPVEDQAVFDACAAIRRVVFVEEQQVPPDLEADGLDQASRHFAVTADDQLVATCRVRLMGSAAKIERVAVLKDYRGLGLGKILMRYLMQELGKIENLRLYKLSSQSNAVPFYEKLGFRSRGSEYMEAGMPHYDMILEKKG